MPIAMAGEWNELNGIMSFIWMDGIAQWSRVTGRVRKVVQNPGTKECDELWWIVRHPQSAHANKPKLIIRIALYQTLQRKFPMHGKKKKSIRLIHHAVRREESRLTLHEILHHAHRNTRRVTTLPCQVAHKHQLRSCPYLSHVGRHDLHSPSGTSPKMTVRVLVLTQ